MLYLVLLNVLMIFALSLALSRNKSKGLFIVLAFFLFVVAGFRDGQFIDYIEYQEAIREGGNARFEVSFNGLVSIIRALGLPSVFVFLVYAALGAGLKMKAILAFRVPIWYALMVYMAHMFTLEECTAMRVGAATGFLMVAFYQLCRKEYLRWFLLTVAASFFHYSALLALFFPLIIKIPINIKTCGGILLIAYLIPLLGVSVQFLLGLFNSELVEYYAHYMKTDNIVNIYNFSQLLYCAIALFVVKHISEFRAIHRYSGELVLVYLFSLVMLPVFQNIPVFAFRGAHIFACMEILLFPLVIKYFWIKRFKIKKKKKIIRLRVVSYILIAYLFYWCNISALSALTMGK